MFSGKDDENMVVNNARFGIFFLFFLAKKLQFLSVVSFYAIKCHRCEEMLNLNQLAPLTEAELWVCERLFCRNMKLQEESVKMLRPFYEYAANMQGVVNERLRARCRGSGRRRVTGERIFTATLCCNFFERQCIIAIVAAQ